MNQTERPDPLDELRRANPDTERRLPSENKARVWAAIQEATMDTNQKTRTRRAWAVGLAGAAVAGVVALALVVLNNGGSPAPSDDPATGIGSCVETYSPETLANREFGFDGTVTTISGDEVTFDVSEYFVGSGDDEVTLTATGMTGTSITSAGGPNLVEGERYLVAGDDTFVWACGFTQPYDEAVAAEWADATP